MSGLVVACGTPAPHQQVERMAAAAPHRGGPGPVVQTLAGAVAVSTSRDRPDACTATDGRTTVAVCGRLDNAGDLLATSAGSAATPAEVVLALRDEPWARVAARMRGSYAVVVVEPDRVVGWRDHLGFEPLFYRRDGGSLLLASEAKQILAGCGKPREADLDVVERIFFHDYADEDPCALRGVERVPKGSVLTLHAGGVALERYWDPDALLETADLAPDEVQERFDALMLQAVERAMRGPDVVGLSGGIDSPALAAYGAEPHERLHGTPLGALSLVYPHLPSVDERRYVELIARESGLRLHLVEPAAQPLDDARRWAELADGPVPTMSLPQYAEFYAAAHGLGYRNVLTGELAEYVVDMKTELLTHLVGHGRAAAVARHVRYRRGRGATVPTLGRELTRVVVPTALTARRQARARLGIPHWLDVERANRSSVRSLVAPRDRWRAVQVAPFSGPGVTMEAESVCQQVVGVTVRRPWADVDLWELFLRLPAELKHPTPQHKALVRTLLRGRVPDAVLNRDDKTYFDDDVLSRLDYDGLHAWLHSDTARLRGVDYARLLDLVDRRDLDLNGYLWAKDLAGAHAFLTTC